MYRTCERFVSSECDGTQPATRRLLTPSLDIEHACPGCAEIAAAWGEADITN